MGLRNAGEYFPSKMSRSNVPLNKWKLKALLRVSTMHPLASCSNFLGELDLNFINISHQ